MPPNTIAVTRPTEWGNPFKVGCHYKRGGACVYLQAFEGYQDSTFTTIQNAEEAVSWYRWYIERSVKQIERVLELRGKDLACWCPLDQPCHADVLLEIANQGEL